MKKAAFIIPGFFHSSDKAAYHRIGEAFTDKGYDVVYIEISWRYKRLADYLEQFKSSYLENRGETNVFFGFSYGALIAFLSASVFQPYYLYLGSIAPYFKEDWAYIPPIDKKEIGQRRTADIAMYSFDKAVSQIRCPVRLFFGQKEQPFVKRRVRIAANVLKGSMMAEIPGVGHDIADNAYIARIRKEIYGL